MLVPFSHFYHFTILVSFSHSNGTEYIIRVGAPFGLKIMSAHFQRIMTTIFRNCTGFVAIFIDDIIVFSNSIEEHVMHLVQVIRTLTAYNLKMNIAKSHIAFLKVYILGHLVTQEGLRIDEENYQV